jgi:hypothetical protein
MNEIRTMHGMEHIKFKSCANHLRRNTSSILLVQCCHCRSPTPLTLKPAFNQCACNGLKWHVYTHDIQSSKRPLFRSSQTICQSSRPCWTFHNELIVSSEKLSVPHLKVETIVVGCQQLLTHNNHTCSRLETCSSYCWRGGRGLTLIST